MPVQIESSESIQYLQRFLTHNKARGMVAELSLESELGQNKSVLERKLMPGGWLLSPKLDTPQYYRYMISVLPVLYGSPEELDSAVSLLEKDRGWQALATFLSQSGIGIIVSGASPRGAFSGLNSLQWKNYSYRNEKLFAASHDEPFASWPGERGRAGKGSPWQPDVLSRFQQAAHSQLTELAMRQAFFYGYLKEQLHKPVEDPYDVDAFVVGYTGIVMPVEIKEKSPTDRGDFGIDAGRILMLLRLCLATDSNALYLIREVGEGESRAFVRWRYITLSDMVIGCRWNLQAGGRSMSGGATQTVMISGTLFRGFSLDNLSEGWLSENKSLQGSARAAVGELTQRLSHNLNQQR